MQRGETMTFAGITPERMDVIRVRAKSEGLDLGKPSGLLMWDGVGLDYAYDANIQRLTITPTIPVGVNPDEVEGVFSRLVRQTDPAHAQAVQDSGLEEEKVKDGDAPSSIKHPEPSVGVGGEPAHAA
jgi:hypothetical protein